VVVLPHCAGGSYLKDPIWFRLEEVELLSLPVSHLLKEHSTT
jgi:hypothetical protein